MPPAPSPMSRIHGRGEMASKFQQLYEIEHAKVRAFQRVRDGAATDRLLKAALAIINNHGLASEFVDALIEIPSAVPSP